MGLSVEAITHRKLQAKEYYLANKETICKRQKELYLKNREKRIQQAKDWRLKNLERIRQHRRANPEIYLKKTNAWKARNRQKVLESSERCRIKKAYGITFEEYQARIESQNNVCEICKQKPNGKRSKSKLHLDHCHITKKLRGFICGNCNTALGMVKDNEEILESMLHYLRKYK